MKSIEFSPAMKKMLFYVAIFFALVFGWYGIKKLMMMWGMAHYQPPAITVSSTTTATKTWQSYLISVGTLTAINGVDISAEVSGKVKEINFNSGQLIKKGEIILALDTSVEEAELKS